MPTKKTLPTKKVAAGTKVSAATPICSWAYRKIYFFETPNERIDNGAITDPALVARVKEHIDTKAIETRDDETGQFAVPINALMEAGFGDMEVRTVSGSLFSLPSKKTASLATLQENIRERQAFLGQSPKHL